MKWEKWLENWDMASLKIKAPFLEMDWSPAEADRDAAWELYIELLTRVATQPLDTHHGSESTALNSVYSLFPTTRAIIKERGRDCIEFTKLAVVVLNQVVRPFTSKWHRVAADGGLDDVKTREEFRDDLTGLQLELVGYARALADMAGVEDLTELEG